MTTKYAMTQWQIAAIEVALKEKASKMADRKSWDFLIKIVSETPKMVAYTESEI